MSSDQAGFVHDVRRKLPRFHWRPLSGIRAGESLADLQRIAIQHDIALPTSFALVGKTLAQADSIARMLDPELDPIELMEEKALEVMAREVERRLEPNRSSRISTRSSTRSRSCRAGSAHVLASSSRGRARSASCRPASSELEAQPPLDREPDRRRDHRRLAAALLVAPRARRTASSGSASPASASPRCSGSTWSGRSSARPASSSSSSGAPARAACQPHMPWTPPPGGVEAEQRKTPGAASCSATRRATGRVNSCRRSAAPPLMSPPT